MGTRNVAILIVEGVELLDFAGPYEVFSSLPDIKVFAIAESMELIRCRNGLVVQPGANRLDCMPPRGN